MNWRDRDGVWHRDAVAKEALEIWIMPPEYEQSWWRFLKPMRPTPAAHVYSDERSRVYGREAGHVASAQFDEILEKATETNWLDPARPDGGLSWSTWEKDIQTKLGTSDR